MGRKLENKDYCVYIRDKKNKVYYVQYRDPTTGEMLTPKSTGMVTRATAERWAELHLNERTRKDDFLTFIKNFYASESEYVSFKLNRKAQYGENHRKHQDAHVKNYILPYLEKKKIKSWQDINLKVIESFQDYCVKLELSGKTINDIITTFHSIAKWEIREKHLTSDPFTGIVLIKHKAKEKGILSKDEIEKLFSSPWSDYQAYILNLISAFCGLRMGEVQAIRRSSICSVIDENGKTISCINIMQAWDKSENKFKGTKNEETRMVPISDFILDKLKDYILMNNIQENQLLFPGTENSAIPVSNKYIISTLYKALKEILNISEEDRKLRNITHHSFRHFFNTFNMNNGIPQYVVMQALGHKSTKMTSQYYHNVSIFDSLLNNMNSLIHK